MAMPLRVDDAAARDAFLRRDLWDALTGLREEAAPRWGRTTARHFKHVYHHLQQVGLVDAGPAAR